MSQSMEQSLALLTTLLIHSKLRFVVQTSQQERISWQSPNGLQCDLIRHYVLTNDLWQFFKSFLQLSIKFDAVKRLPQ